MKLFAIQDGGMVSLVRAENAFRAVELANSHLNSLQVARLLHDLTERGRLLELPPDGPAELLAEYCN